MMKTVFALPDWVRFSSGRSWRGLVGVLLVFGIAISTASVASAQNIRVIAGFGDSITRGWPYTAIDQYGARGRSYGVWLEPLMAESRPGEVWHWHNWGFGRMNSLQAIDQLDLVMQTSRPEWVFMMMGVNDLWDGISAPSTAAHNGYMIDRIRAYGATPIVSNFTPSWYPEMGGSRIPVEYNPAVEAVIRQRQAIFYDAWAQFSPIWASVNTDGLHMNARGIELLADGWCRAMPLCTAADEGGDGEGMPWLDLLLLD